jgi:DNA-directed RNA polymerase subunit RPC12/RpoP
MAEVGRAMHHRMKHYRNVPNSDEKRVRKPCLLCGNNMHRQPTILLKGFKLNSYWACTHCGYKERA